MPNILLIEDDSVFGQLAKTTLETLDPPFTVTWVTTKHDALNLLSKYAYESIILDLILSNSAGALLVMAIKDSAPTTPIILMTAMREDEVEKEILPMVGPYKVLYKRGLTMDQLALAVSCRAEAASVAKPLMEAAARISESKTSMEDSGVKDRPEALRGLQLGGGKKTGQGLQK